MNISLSREKKNKITFSYHKLTCVQFNRNIEKNHSKHHDFLKYIVLFCNAPLKEYTFEWIQLDKGSIKKHALKTMIFLTQN